jgi:hypothetical protein
MARSSIPARSSPGSISSSERRAAARRWTLLATSLGFAVVQLDVSVVNVAIKPIGEPVRCCHSGSSALPRPAADDRGRRAADGGGLRVDRSRAGVASGTLNSARQTGSVIGVALFGSLIAGGGALVSGLHVALEISLGLVLAVAALSLGIGRNRTGV